MKNYLILVLLALIGISNAQWYGDWLSNGDPQKQSNDETKVIDTGSDIENPITVEEGKPIKNRFGLPVGFVKPESLQGYQHENKGYLTSNVEISAPIKSVATPVLASKSAQFIKVGHKYYWIAPDKNLSWHAAHNLCRRNNAQLPTIQTDEEMRALNDFLLKSEPNDEIFWTAANSLADEKEFQWASNGQQMSFEKWSPALLDILGEEDHCVRLRVHEDEYWMDIASCSLKANVICEVDTSCMYRRR